MVAVRSMGLAFESLVGFDINGKQMCSVSEGTLRTLLEVSNDRFQANAARIARFRELLRQSKISGSGAKKRDDNKDWEDPEVRKQRKRAEGLKRKEMLSETKEDPIVDPEDAADIEFFP
jgi:tRNA wybutosine-synthesizing protein 3